MEYTSVLTAISLLKWVEALVLLSTIYSIAWTAWQKFDIVPITTYFSFDEVSLNIDVKLTVIIFNVS